MQYWRRLKKYCGGRAKSAFGVTSHLEPTRAHSCRQSGRLFAILGYRHQNPWWQVQHTILSIKNALSNLDFESAPIKAVFVLQGHSFCNKAEITVVQRKNSCNDWRETKLNRHHQSIQIPSSCPCFWECIVFKCDTFFKVRLLQEILVPYEGLTIDSMERIQGSERRVIIVSAVRTKIKWAFVSVSLRF